MRRLTGREEAEAVRPSQGCTQAARQVLPVEVAGELGDELQAGSAEGPTRVDVGEVDVAQSLLRGTDKPARYPSTSSPLCSRSTIVVAPSEDVALNALSHIELPGRHMHELQPGYV